MVIKKRHSASRADLRQWNCKDLLFINSYGEENNKHITFTHFKQDEPDQLPTIRVLLWSNDDTDSHLKLCVSELQNLEYKSGIAPEEWQQTWSAVFKRKPEHSIKTAKDLSKRLAKLAQDVRENAKTLLKMETDQGPFRKIMKQFQQVLIHDLKIDDFADMYAQTIAYGLLYTAIINHNSEKPNQISGERLKQLILPTNNFLKEIMESFFDIGVRRWSNKEERLVGIDFDELGVNDIVDTLKDESTDLDAVLADFGKRNHKEDPVIHFYELFLKEYDALLRKGRGVYYTPQPVVSFIVRSVHEVLRKEFGLELGLADTTTWGEMITKNPKIKLPQGVGEDEFFVQILDPACGTGTFLVETIDLIHKIMVDKWESEGKDKDEIEKLWERYVPHKLLPRLYGFELMMAPYAIAHMKIGIRLSETGYTSFAEDKQRVRVYLTNTLEEHQDVIQYAENLDPAMAEETREANEIKLINSLTVIIGNPPYSGLSLNMNDWADDLLKGRNLSNVKARNYYDVDGIPLGERKVWLQDDYVKFIRYAQYRLDNTGIGVLGFITNHSFLDNPTFRGMRNKILDSFNVLSFVDLHGNAKKKEVSPNGTKDENVFEIKQGVAISVLRNVPNISDQHVFYTSFWGDKWIKNRLCTTTNVLELEGQAVDPNYPGYFFVIRDESGREEYETYASVSSIFPLNVTGIVTARDDFVVDFDVNSLLERIKIFRDLSLGDNRIRDMFFSGKGSSKYLSGDSRSWKLSQVRKIVFSDSQWKSREKLLNYRVFDARYIYYTDWMVDWPRPEVMRHMLAGDNLGLITCRQRSQSEGLWSSVGISNLIIESCAISNKTKEINYLFPLYLYPEENDLDFTENEWFCGNNKRTPNLEKAFVDKISQAVKMTFVSDGKGNLDDTFGPEDLLSYVYSVFHSPSYRERYASFLKYDFPRVPIISDKELFIKLVRLGQILMSLHLMESDQLNEHITSFPIEGDNEVTKVGETGKKLTELKDGIGKLYINNTQYFDGLPVDVWNFLIGGYQVCYKWLADRKNAKRKLAPEDIEHYHRIVVALNETIKIMNQIDEAIEDHGGWPIN